MIGPLRLSNVISSGDVVDEFVYGINAGQKVSHTLNRVFKITNVGLNVKICVHERLFLQTVLYAVQMCSITESDKKKLNVQCVPHNL